MKTDLAWKRTASYYLRERRGPWRSKPAISDTAVWCEPQLHESCSWCDTYHARVCAVELRQELCGGTAHVTALVNVQIVISAFSPELRESQCNPSWATWRKYPLANGVVKVVSRPWTVGDWAKCWSEHGAWGAASAWQAILRQKYMAELVIACMNTSKRWLCILLCI
jgi:hypothetical protein